MPGNDSYTKLLLHLDNNVIDSSDSSHSVSNNGVTFSNTIMKWGYSGYFSGSGANLSIPASSDWQQGSQTYTVDFWMYPLQTVNSWAGVFNCGSIGTFDFYIRSDGSNTDANLHLGTGTVGLSNAITFDSWNHVAIVKDDSNYVKVYIDGVYINGTQASSITPNETFYIGYGFHTAASIYDFKGYIEEFRISKGIERWTENFTPSTEPYDAFSYKISGSLSEDAKIYVIDQTSDVLEVSESKTSGNWSANCSDGNKIVTAVKSDGNSISYGNVTPILP